MDNINLFTDFGFGFGSLGGELKPVEKKTEKKAEKKTEKKTEKKKTTKSNPAKGVKLDSPVHVYGRNFQMDLSGDNLTLQSVAEQLYAAGIREAAHGGVKFCALDTSTVLLVYPDRGADKDVQVTLPVSVVDGNRVSEYSASDFSEPEDDISVGVLVKKGLGHPAYAGLELAYDASSSLALPVFEKAEISLLPSGSVVYSCGTEFRLEKDMSPEEAVPEYLGELPLETTAVFYKTAQEGEYVLMPAKPAGAKLLEVDRAFAGVTEENKEPAKVEEKINLPVKVVFVNYGEVVEMTPDTFGGKDKVKRTELMDEIKKVFPELSSKDRKVDSYYLPESGRFSVALSSGKKGCGCMIDTPVFSVKDGQFSYKLPLLPLEIMWEIADYFLEDVSKESVVQIWYNKNTFYRVVKPVSQDTSKVHVNYTFDMLKESMDDSVLVMTVHSHNTMEAFFSPVDDMDELYIRGIYGVFGELDTNHVHTKFRYTDGKGFSGEILPEQLLDDC